ncbi:3-deoxy-manno-octulosonate cytidylyltransferase [Neptuniibacter sp. QD48_11]|uniref:3-deoxy-manno-octulosonate cytidylyltransferase n=1 Tax=unclassified Neptuniibacter TaxID=2630693 RepID=UPI0039F50C9F
MDKIGIVIPARYKSTRLPGKPLIDLLGKTMIQRTWERCIQALPENQVFVATDNEEIAKHVREFGGNYVITSTSCLTGTDRLAEANKKLGLDLVINVQGDEPLIDPEEIKMVIQFALKHPGEVVNAIAKIEKEEEYRSNTIPKVAKSLNNDLLYMSRLPIPGGKNDEFEFAYKQICIYAFPKSALNDFCTSDNKTPFESIEDIEILRFIERGVNVKLVEVSGKSIAVDVKEDVSKVIGRLKDSCDT